MPPNHSIPASGEVTTPSNVRSLKGKEKMATVNPSVASSSFSASPSPLLADRPQSPPYQESAPKTSASQPSNVSPKVPFTFTPIMPQPIAAATSRPVPPIVVTHPSSATILAQPGEDRLPATPVPSGGLASDTCAGGTTRSGATLEPTIQQAITGFTCSARRAADSASPSPNALQLQLSPLTQVGDHSSRSHSPLDKESSQHAAQKSSEGPSSARIRANLARKNDTEEEEQSVDEYEYVDS